MNSRQIAVLVFVIVMSVLLASGLAFDAFDGLGFSDGPLAPLSTLRRVRNAALLLLLAGFLAGCGSGTHDAATTTSAKKGTLQAIWDQPGDNVTVVPGTGDFSPGVVRYSFLVVRMNGELVLRPTATV